MTMPLQEVILKCSEGKEIYHPTHGLVRRLEVFHENNGECDRIWATYLDTENCHIQLSSDKLSESFDAFSFTTLINGIMLIPDKSILAIALLSLLHKDSSMTEDFSCIKTNANINLTDQVLRKPFHTESDGMENYGEIPKLLSYIDNQQDISNNDSIVPSQTIKTEIQDYPQDTAIDNEYILPENSKEHENSNIEAALDDIIENKFFSSIVLFDGTKILFPIEPRDMFHIATPDILEHFNKHEKKKLILQQAYIEWKYCLSKNADGFMLIHLAVMNNDIDLVRRQIEILKAKEGTVDVLANGMSPLHIAIKNSNIECIKVLLAKGANPLLYGVDRRNSLHFAALATPEVLDVVITAYIELYEKKYATAKYTQKDDFFTIPDALGYNAFMLACKNSSFENAAKIYHQCPSILDVKMSSSGSTALHNEISYFLALYNRKQAIDLPKAPLNTVVNLLQMRANPNIENHYGQTFYDILKKCNNGILKSYLHRIASGKPFADFDQFWNVFTDTKYDVDIAKCGQSSEVKDCENQRSNGVALKKSLENNKQYESDSLNGNSGQKRFERSEQIAETVKKKYFKRNIKNTRIIEVKDNFYTVLSTNDDSIKVSNPLPQTHVNVSKTYAVGYPIKRKHLNVSKTYPIKRKKSNVDAFENPVSIVDDATKSVSKVDDTVKSVSISNATESIVHDTKNSISKIDDTKKSVSISNTTEEPMSKVDDTRKAVSIFGDTKKAVSIVDDAKKSVSKFDETKKSVSIVDDPKKSVSIINDAKKSVSKVGDIKNVLNYDLNNSSTLIDDAIIIQMSPQTDTFSIDMKRKSLLKLNSVLNKHLNTSPSPSNVSSTVDSMKRGISTSNMLNIPKIKLKKTDLKSIKNVFVLKQGFAK